MTHKIAFPNPLGRALGAIALSVPEFDGRLGPMWTPATSPMQKQDMFLVKLT